MTKLLPVIYQAIDKGGQENDIRTELFAESMEKKVLLDVLQEALVNLMPEEKELAVKVSGEKMSVYEFAWINDGSLQPVPWGHGEKCKKGVGVQPYGL